MSKIAAILAPLVDVAQMFLSGFRFSFNLMTWRDPSLTFWFLLLGSALVVILHLFPWRLFLFVTGFALVGPQNWIARIVKEKEEGKEVFDDDKKVEKRRRDNRHFYSEDAPYFSSFAPDNRVLHKSRIDTSFFMEVAVPTTPICFRRFNDWPPEPEYARVTKATPPMNDPTAQLLLETDRFELYDGDCEYDDDTIIAEKKKKHWGKRAARKITKTVTPNLKFRKKLSVVDETK